MELGNIIFGNSRGKYPIERGVGFEQELSRLFDSYAPDRDNSWREYGEEFENEIFTVREYYWGDCTCGFDNLDIKTKHSEDCYQTRLDKEKIKAGWIKNKYFGLDIPESWSWDYSQKKEKKIMKSLCKELNIGWNNGLSCAIHCTCDYDTKYKKEITEAGFPNGCKDNCKLVLPNFHYKPTNFQIQWYKYPLRDSYSNKKITLREFKKMIDECINSIKN